MSEEQFRYETKHKTSEYEEDKRSPEISKNAYKVPRIKKTGYDSHVIPSNLCHGDPSHKQFQNPRYVMMGHVTGPKSGELEPGSSSGQQAMGAEDSSSGDGEPMRDEMAAREMRPSEYPLSNLLSKSNMSEWRALATLSLDRRVSVWTAGERQRVSSMSGEQFSYETKFKLSEEQFSYEDKGALLDISRNGELETLSLDRRASVCTAGERQKASSMSGEKFSYDTKLKMWEEKFSYEDKGALLGISKNGELATLSESVWTAGERKRASSMPEEQFSFDTKLKMYKRSLEISKNGYKAPRTADHRANEKIEERIKKKGYESHVVPSNFCHGDLRHKQQNPRYVVMGHVFTGSGSGGLEPGSSSGQQAVDAEDGSSDDDDDEPVRDEFAQWLRRMTAREMRRSEYPLSNLLCKSNKYQWSVVVAPGRYITVDPGRLFLIKKISYVSDRVIIIPGAPDCQLYLGINRTRAESVIGSLRPGSWNELHVNLLINERFTLGHSGFDCVRFSGHIYVPQGQREPPPSELRVKEVERRNLRDRLRWSLPLELTAKVFSYLSTPEVAKVAERVCVFFRAAGRLPSAYSDINLCNLRYGENLIALMCIRRARQTINSFSVGFTGRGNGDFDMNAMYSGRLLEPLQYLGMGLKKLKLFELDIIGLEDLTPVLAICPRLTNLELNKLKLVPLESAMQLASVHCRNLQFFAYFSKDLDDEAFGQIGQAPLEAFLTSVPHITTLTLGGVHMSDCQIVMIMRRLKNLRSLDLTDSSRFTGSFLTDLLNQELVVEALVLRRCRGLVEVQLAAFFTHLGERALFFHKLKNLTIIGSERGGLLQEGFEERIRLNDLLVARRTIGIVTDYEFEPPVEFDQEELDRYLVDAFDPFNQGALVWNEEHGEWDLEQVELPNDIDEYAVLDLGVRRKRMKLIYWGRN